MDYLSAFLSMFLQENLPAFNCPPASVINYAGDEKGYTLHVHTAGVGSGEKDTH